MMSSDITQKFLYEIDNFHWTNWTIFKTSYLHKGCKKDKFNPNLIPPFPIYLNTLNPPFLI